MTDFFKDIIDIPSVRNLMESLQEATGSPVSLLDHQGQILVTAGCQDICTTQHRKHPKTAERCRESDLFFANLCHFNR